jgi:predicted nuclease with RNAse H fold
VNEIYLLGIDLAGPSNRANTVVAGFLASRGKLEHQFEKVGCDDRELTALLGSFVPVNAKLVVGLDAPLSYNPGGGDRPADRELRRRLIAAGLVAGTVMTPTMSRMVYLTLRGVIVARLLTAIRPGCQLVEVHPAGAMALRGAPVAVVRKLKSSAAARRSLQAWLATQGLADLPTKALNDHTVAAYAAALAAWDWSRGKDRWSHRADPPGHPYDLAC